MHRKNSLNSIKQLKWSLFSERRYYKHIYTLQTQFSLPERHNFSINKHFVMYVPETFK